MFVKALLARTHDRLFDDVLVAVMQLVTEQISGLIDTESEQQISALAQTLQVSSFFSLFF